MRKPFSSSLSKGAVLTAAASAAAAAQAARRTPHNSNLVLSAATAGTTYRTETYASASGLDLTILATAVPLVVDINGVKVTLSADTVITCTNAALNFIYLKNDGTLSRTATAPAISKTQPSGPAANDHWFDLTGQGTMYKYNGSAWVATPEILIAVCYATGGAIVAQTIGTVPAGVPLDEIYTNVGEPTTGTVLTDGVTLTLTGPTVGTFYAFVNGATLNHGAELTANLQFELRAQWGFLFDATSAMQLTGLGGRRGAGGTGAGSAPPVSLTTLMGAGGGGGGGSGGAGANGGTRQQARLGTGSTNNGGAINTNAAALTILATINTGTRFRGVFGGQGGMGVGGGGGGGDGTAGGDGGAGGGFLPLIGLMLILASGAVLSTNGAAGTDAAAGNRGGGGGGSAGYLYAYCAAFFNFGATLTATGGSGGNKTGTGGTGTAGADGVIKLEKW